MGLFVVSEQSSGRGAKKTTFYQTNELAEHTQAFQLSLQTNFAEKTRQLKRGKKTNSDMLAGLEKIHFQCNCILLRQQQLWNHGSYETLGLILCSCFNFECNFLKEQASSAESGFCHWPCLEFRVTLFQASGATFCWRHHQQEWGHRVPKTHIGQFTPFLPLPTQCSTTHVRVLS